MEKFLIAGLGNPGRKYRRNRHNIGFMAVDAVAEAAAIPLSGKEKRAKVGHGRIAGRRVILAQPQVFMNRSGDAVGPLADYYDVATEQVLVIYDELDLPFGTIRLRAEGGSGGHNGMRSIIYHLGNGFPRMRLGIGRPPGRMDPAAYVLQDFAEAERPLLEDVLAEAGRAVYTFLNDGIEMAMSRHNQSLVTDEEKSN
jgi:PTH1 family peptidyl-tRNA hydrolase